VPHSSGGQLTVSHHSYWSLIPNQTIRDIQCTKWHWGRFSECCLVSPFNSHVTNCVTSINYNIVYFNLYFTVLGRRYENKNSKLCNKECIMSLFYSILNVWMSKVLEYFCFWISVYCSCSVIHCLISPSSDKVEKGGATSPFPHMSSCCGSLNTGTDLSSFFLIFP
jgi:hypothetical protein